MTNRGSGVPVTWRELRDEMMEASGATARGVAYFQKDYSRHEPESPLFGPPFHSAASVLVYGAILGDLDAARELAGEMIGLAHKIATSKSPVLNKIAPQSLAALMIFDLQTCAGWTDAPLPDPAPLLERLRRMDLNVELYQRQTIWAHLAHGRTEGLDDLLPHDFNAAPPDPGAQFGPNVQGTQVQIARAIAQGAGPETVAATWSGFLNYFPRLLAADVSSFPELLWAARAVHVVIGGAPVDTTLDWLTSQIEF
jgi:hypothetical protein